MSTSDAVSNTWTRHYKWAICLALLVITIFNYVNRQAFSLVAPVISVSYHLSNLQLATIIDAFLVAYTIGQLFSGRFMDWIGSRKGFTLAATTWSIASILTSLAVGVWSFSVCRFLLGTAESANFPGAVKVVAECFPPEERSTAVGVFSSGASVGAILTPPLAAYLIVHFGWRTALIAFGLPSLAWVLLWWEMYLPTEVDPSRIGGEDASKLAGNRQAQMGKPTAAVPWAYFLRQRLIWGVFLARLIEEPVSWLYFSWLGVYLNTFRDVPLQLVGGLLVIPFVTLDFGFVAGGWTASRLIMAGWSLNGARKTIMTLSALLMVSCIPAAHASTNLGFILFVSIATYGHGSWGANIFTIPGDIVPHHWVGSIYGLTAFGGGLGSILFMQLTGKLLDVQKSFHTVFLIAGILPVVAALIFLTVTGNVTQLLAPAQRPSTADCITNPAN